MRRMIVSCLLLFVITGHLLGQATIAGKWETEAPGPRGIDKIVMDFKVDGTKLTGTVLRSSPPGQGPVTLEGKVDKTRVEFTVKSPDGSRTIKFTGELKGDTIEFTREVTGAGGGNGIFGGETGPKNVTAKRAK